MPTFTLTNPVPGSAAAAAAAGGLQPSTIDAGVPVQIGTNIQAAAATATTPQTPAFAVQPRGDGGDRTLNVSAVGIGGVPTTVTVNLLASYDGGATWQAYGAGGSGLALVNAGAAQQQQVKNVVAGPLYSFAVAALALGGASGVNIDASLS